MRTPFRISVPEDGTVIIDRETWDAVVRVANAINNPGRPIALHRNARLELWAKWSTLSNAVESLAARLKEIDEAAKRPLGDSKC